MYNEDVEQPKVTIPTNPSGTYTFSFGPEWRNHPQAGHPYVGMKPPPPLFSQSSSTGEKAEPVFQIREKPFQTSFGETKRGLSGCLLVILLGIAWLLIFS